MATIAVEFQLGELAMIILKAIHQTKPPHPYTDAEAFAVLDEDIQQQYLRQRRILHASNEEQRRRRHFAHTGER